MISAASRTRSSRCATAPTSRTRSASSCCRNRFRWEADADASRRPTRRTHSALVFNEVTAVRHHHGSRRDEPDRHPRRCWRWRRKAPVRSILRFAGDGAIRLEIDRLACHLEDVGEPWPTPWKPAHPVA